jgi:hypothetical protein
MLRHRTLFRVRLQVLPWSAVACAASFAAFASDCAATSWLRVLVSSSCKPVILPWKAVSSACSVLSCSSEAESSCCVALDLLLDDARSACRTAHQYL